MDETEHAKPSITNNPFINEPRYFNLFECGKTSWTILVPRANKRAWKPQRTSTISKCKRP